MPAIKIIDHVRDEHCVPRLEGDTREAVIMELAESFVASGAINEEERDRLLVSVIEREEAATTGVGNGVALPHPKTTDDVTFLDNVLIAVGLRGEGVDFRATDGEPVYVVFLVASPSNLEYLEVAKRIAALARAGTQPEKWRRVLKQSRTPAAVREALQDAWEELAP
jgi:mannitol/fructose-specific phosphotransferase system IIA component (Ntr-type)